MTTTALQPIVERDGSALRLLARAMDLLSRGRDAGKLLLLGEPHAPLIEASAAEPRS